MRLRPAGRCCATRITTPQAAAAIARIIRIFIMPPTWNAPRIAGTALKAGIRHRFMFRRGRGKAYHIALSLAVIDGAARGPDAVYEALRPMLAVAEGRPVARRFHRQRTSISITRAAPCATIWCSLPAGMKADCPG